jgi:hypothetical protein
MPTNGPSELSMSSLYGIPLFTYGMIGVTTIILAYVTFMDDSEGNSFANPDDQSIEEVVEEPVVEEPVVEEPVVEEPVIEEPVIEEVVEEPVLEENIAPVEEEKVVPTEIKGGKKSKKNKTKRKSNRNIL